MPDISSEWVGDSWVIILDGEPGEILTRADADKLITELHRAIEEPPGDDEDLAFETWRDLGAEG